MAALLPPEVLAKALDTRTRHSLVSAEQEAGQGQSGWWATAAAVSSQPALPWSMPSPSPPLTPRPPAPTTTTSPCRPPAAQRNFPELPQVISLLRAALGLALGLVLLLTV